MKFITVFNYPDNDGGNLMCVFFDILKTTGHRIDWQKGLKDILTEHGYDYKTLKNTCDKIKNYSNDNKKY